MRKIVYLGLLLWLSVGYTHAQKAYIQDAGIKEQLNFVEEEASKWQNYVMITDTWFRQLKKNVTDTLDQKNQNIGALETTIASRDSVIGQLNSELEKTKTRLETSEREKNAFQFLGLSMAKPVFISLVLFVFFALLIAIGAALFLFQRSNHTANRTKKDLEKMKEEFEDYRQRARQKYENLVVQHHKEIQKLKE